MVRKRRPPKRRTEAGYKVLLRQWSRRLRAHAYTQRIPGFTRDEVEADLKLCLWKAYMTFDPSMGRPFGVYFWSIWTNHKGMAIRAFMAEKRAALEVPFDHEDLLALSPLVFPEELLPASTIALNLEHHSRAVWLLLAMGYTGVEIRQSLHISRRQYDKIIAEWCTDEMYRTLKEGNERRRDSR